MTLVSLSPRTRVPERAHAFPQRYNRALHFIQEFLVDAPKEDVKAPSHVLRDCFQGGPKLQPTATSYSHSFCARIGK